MARKSKEARRLLNVNVIEADISTFGAIDTTVKAGLYRVNDQKEIESVTRPNVVKGSQRPAYRYERRERCACVCQWR